jgi:hypothetical protein
VSSASTRLYFICFCWCPRCCPSCPPLVDHAVLDVGVLTRTAWTTRGTRVSCWSTLRRRFHKTLLVSNRECRFQPPPVLIVSLSRNSRFWVLTPRCLPATSDAMTHMVPGISLRLCTAASMRLARQGTYSMV